MMGWYIYTQHRHITNFEWKTMKRACCKAKSMHLTIRPHQTKALDFCLAPLFWYLS